MYATIRRFEGIDESRTAEITRTANEKLIPRLSELQGFNGYFLFEPANGVLTSISLFENPSEDYTKALMRAVPVPIPRRGATGVEPELQQT